MWERIGIGVVATLLLALVAIVGLSPSTPSQVATGAPLPTVIVTTSTTRSVLGSGIPATTEVTLPPTTEGIRPPGGTTTTSAPSSRPGGCVDPDTCQTAPTIVDRGLRTAQPAELAAIAAAVPPPPGQQVDSVMISVTSPTWGVLHVAAGALTTQEYVLIEILKGTWTPIDSGYPKLHCNQAIPSAVLIDLGTAATLCP
jgi:hypothetical protein